MNKKPNLEKLQIASQLQETKKCKQDKFPQF